MKKVFIFTVLFMLPALTKSLAGAWVQEKGKSLHIFTYYFYTTDKLFKGYGDREAIPNNGKFTKHEFNYYMEAGLLKRLTLVGNFFFDFLEFKDAFSKDRNRGLGDQEVGIRVNLFNEPFVFSVQGLFVFPAYSLDDTPLLGNQDVGLEGKLLAGKSFLLLGIPSYVNTEAGIRFRIGEPSDQIRYQLLLGIKPRTGWEIILAIDGIEGLRNEEPFRVSKNVTINPDFSLIKGTGSVVIPITRSLSLEFGGFWHFMGRNTGEGWGIKVGSWFRL